MNTTPINFRCSGKTAHQAIISYFRNNENAALPVHDRSTKTYHSQKEHGPVKTWDGSALLS